MTLQLNFPSYKQQSSVFYHLTFKSKIPRVILSNTAAMSFVFIYQPQAFRVSFECFFVTLIFFIPVFRTCIQKSKQSPGEGGRPCAAGVPEPTSGYAMGARIHSTTVRTAVPPPSHSTMFVSPGLGREVNLVPAASPHLSSGEHPRCSDRGCHQDSAKRSGWMFSELLWYRSFLWILCAFKLWILAVPGSSMTWFY